MRVARVSETGKPLIIQTNGGLLLPDLDRMREGGGAGRLVPLRRTMLFIAGASHLRSRQGHREHVRERAKRSERHDGRDQAGGRDMWMFRHLLNEYSIVFAHGLQMLQVMNLC